MADKNLHHLSGAKFYFITTDGARLSRRIERIATMRRVLKRVRRSVPTAYGVRETLFR